MQRCIDDILDRYDVMSTDFSDPQAGHSDGLKTNCKAPIFPAFLPEISAQIGSARPEVTLVFFGGENAKIQNGFLGDQYDVILCAEEIPNHQIEVLSLVFALHCCLGFANPIRAARSS